MGKYFKTINRPGNWNARIGGKPNCDWSGLYDTTITAGTMVGIVTSLQALQSFK